MVILRGDTMPGARRTAQPLLQARSPECVTTGTARRRVRGNGVAAAARAGARQRLRQRARLPPHSGETPGYPSRQRRGTLACSRTPLVDPRALPTEPGQGRTAGAPKACP